MSRAANSRRLVVMTLQKIRRQSRDARLGEDRRQRLELLVGTERRAADQPVEIGAAGNQCVELIEIFLDGVDGLVVEGKLEQRAGVSASHTGDDRTFACHWDARCYDFIHRPDAVAGGGANYWNPRGNSDLWGRRRSLRKPPEIEG